MNRVLAVHAEDFDCVVEPGVTRERAQRASARPRPVLSGRSWRRRLARRNGLDARFRNDGRALWHDERQRAGAEGRAPERRTHVHVTAGAEVLGRLRSHPARRRRRRHAGRHHRADPETARHSRGDRGRGLPRSRRSRLLRRGHRGDPDRHSDGARRAPRRGAGSRLQCPREARSARAADALSRISRHRGRRGRAVGALRRYRATIRRRSFRVGDASRRSARGCGRHVTTCSGR